MDPISREKMQQQFKVINLIFLAMISLPFILAAIVIAIHIGYISLEPFFPAHAADITVVQMLKYILLAVSFLIILINLFVNWFVNNIAFKSLTSYISYIFGKLFILAFCEAVSIYGLVLFILSRNPTDFFIFMLISLLYFYLFRPKYADWERLWQQQLSLNKSSWSNKLL